MWDCKTSKMSSIPACRAQRLRLIRGGATRQRARSRSSPSERRRFRRATTLLSRSAGPDDLQRQQTELLSAPFPAHRSSKALDTEAMPPTQRSEGRPLHRSSPLSRGCPRTAFVCTSLSPRLAHSGTQLRTRRLIPTLAPATRASKVTVPRR